MFRLLNPNQQRSRSAQAVIEIAIFGAVLIFLIGVIIRNHLSASFGLNHQVRAMKLALKQSYASSVGATPSNSRNSGSVLFIEDRLSPDFNKFATIDRTPFVANGSGTMTNRLFYPVDFGEVDQNLPVFDIFINGKHIPLTTASYVFKIIYNPQIDGNTCPNDWVGAKHGLEYERCHRQLAEWNNNSPTFFKLAVNGTSDFNTSGNFDLLRNNWDVFHKITPENRSIDEDNVPEAMKEFISWQWQNVVGIASSMNLGTEEAPNYPSMDVSGTLKEQVVYAVSQKDPLELRTILSNPNLTPYMLNPSPGTGYPAGNSGYNLLLTNRLANDTTTGYIFSNDGGSLGLTRKPVPGNITGVVVLDYQLGDIDFGYDVKTSPGPQPGLLPQMSMYSWVKPGSANSPGTYLEIKEGKLYNPESNQTVRSISSKDHVDLISRMIQLSNNTQRFCVTDSSGRFTRPERIEDQGGYIDNPVEACGDCSGANIDKTCFDPISRVLFVRTLVGDTTKRKWFTDVTKGIGGRF